MELIITEKNDAARRIADILSDGSSRTERVGGVDVYAWGTHRVIGLAGHVVGVDFPEEYSEWRDVEPAELVHAPVETRVTKPDIVSSLETLAREADRVTIATDYDREGELIGKEAYELVREVDGSVPVDRVRFSSITENEVRTAFADPDDLDFELAAAGEARQRIDLLWGAALTRFLSLTAGQRGEDFISVGRVQTPTLKLIVDKEREIRAFDPDTYWELFADLAGGEITFEAQYFYDDDGSEAERIWSESHATDAETDLSDAGTATVESVSRRRRTDDPPVPFDTTQFIKAAGSLGFNAGQAMSIAEDLYTAGYISYPRTDNTVYPDDLDPAERLAVFEGTPFAESAASLLDGGDLEPTRGDSETTDHPPIHPTPDVPEQDALSDAEWRLYELVVRRFFATLAEPAVWEHLRVTATAGDRQLKANGKRLVEAGYHDVYPYVDTSENHVPDLTEGTELAVDSVTLEEKETKPPRRYGQSRLVETMEKLGIGTKSTRHNVIEKLYDRGYLEDDPPRPTQLAMAVVEAAEEYADLVVSEEMTQELEAEMTAIVEGEKDLTEVTEDSREALDRIFDSLAQSREAIGEHLRSSLKADRTLGPCPECGSDLLVRENRYGSYFVGCDGYPDCEFTAPLPNRGEPQLLDEVCSDHDLHHVKMLDGRNTFVHGCPRCQVEDAEDTDDEVIGPCPECHDAEGGELAIKHLRNGSRLVGCTRYPDCEYSVPLPRRGDIEVTEQRCDDHDLPELRIVEDDDVWDFGCPICNYREYVAQRDADLASIDGIGAKTKEKLQAAGIEDVTDLLDIDPEAAATEIEGVSADRLADWQSAIG